MISIEQARHLYTGADPVHDFAHVLRVLHLAERITAAEGANWAIVRAAVLLHDANREGEAHQEAAGDLVRTHLPGADTAFTEAVRHAVRSHRYSAGVEPRTLEAKVVFDADKLDSIGAVGVARAFAYAGRHLHPLYVPADDTAPVTAAQRDTSAYHEYLYKLRHIAGRLYTPTAQRIAAERHVFMAGFFERLKQEVEGMA